MSPTRLFDEIENVVKSRQLPSDLAKALDHIRIIGNFAAHPNKSVDTGSIIGVESGEAEWTLQVLSELFDFYYARRNKLERARKELEKKVSRTEKRK